MQIILRTALQKGAEFGLRLPWGSRRTPCLPDRSVYGRRMSGGITLTPFANEYRTSICVAVSTLRAAPVHPFVWTETTQEIGEGCVGIAVTCTFTSAPSATSSCHDRRVREAGYSKRRNQTSPFSSQFPTPPQSGTASRPCLKCSECRHYPEECEPVQHRSRGSRAAAACIQNIDFLDETAAISYPAGAMHIELRIDIDAGGRRGLNNLQLDTAGQRRRAAATGARGARMVPRAQFAGERVRLLLCCDGNIERGTYRQVQRMRLAQ